MKAPHLPPLLLLTLSLLSLPSVCGAAPADDAAILGCRAMSDVHARLACYDAIPVGAPAALSPATSRTPSPVASAVAATPRASAEQSFGLEAVKRKEAEPQSIESSIEGEFRGWEANSQIKLANGQVWRVVDGSSAVLSGMTNVRVKVVRNLFGTTFLEIEGTNNSPKVRRVR